MDRCIGEPRKIWYEGRWYEFSTSSERDELIRDMNESEQKKFQGRTGEYVA